MRKFLNLSPFVLLLLLLTVIFASCNDSGVSAETNDSDLNKSDSAHVHEWSEWIETFTCTEDGVRERSCACGEKETEAVVAPGHNIGVWKWDPPTTCTQSGIRHLECRVCGYRFQAEEEKPLNHWRYKVVTLRTATCTTTGLEEKVCEFCSEVFETKEIPRLKHQMGALETVLEATCTEKGKKSASCLLCGEVIQTNDIPAKGHTYDFYVKALDATCTEAGRETASCLECGAITEREIAPKGHTPGEWTTEKEATVMADGLKYQVCEVCSERVEIAKLYATGTPGLEYEFNEYGQGYQLVGIGTCTSSDIVIANGIDGYPVYGIYINYDDKADWDFVRSVTIPENIKYLSDLRDMRYLESVKISESNPNYYSVDNCVIDRKTKTLVLGCAGSIIPSDGSVTMIDHSAFSNNLAMTEIVIPEGVLEIGSGAFEYCENLKTVVLPKSVTRIYEYAFNSCKSLENINIEDTSLKYLEYYVFKDCISLKKIAIPASVERISSGVFYLCPNLTDVAIDPANKTFYMKGNCIIERETKTLVRGFTNSVVPTDGSVEIIGGAAFTGCDIVEVIIPDCVKKVQTGAFGNCTKLRKVTLPKDLTEIECALFYGCESLEDVVIPDGVTMIDLWAFQDCKSLKKIVIPEGVKELVSTFNGCSSLEEIVIPDSVEYIGDVFWECRGLKKVTLGKGLKGIYEVTFFGCSSLREIEIFGNIEFIDIRAFEGCSSLETVILHEGVREIGERAFQGCSSLEKIVIPASLEKIDHTAFTCASQNLKEIVLDEKNEKYVLVDGCLVEKESGTLVLKCADANIPEDGSVKVIGAGVFSGHDITEVKLPASVTTIGNYAFYGCPSLKTAEVPEGVTIIGYYAFESCTALESIRIPSSITQICDYAFAKCTVLKDVSFAPRSTDIDLGSWIFYECTSLVSFTFPEGITKTGSYMFYKCSSLEHVVLPQTLKTVRGSFGVCESLKELSIPASVTHIHSSAFSSAMEVLNFEGTMAQWNKISKLTSYGSKWYSGSNIKIVRCTDGEISLASLE